MRTLRVLAVLVVALTIVPASASAKTCGTHSIGTAYFSGIRVKHTTCARAKRLLDQATLSKNRQGNVFWIYAGWDWSIQGRDEMSNIIRGKRGGKRIRAIWSAT
jgi:hypothetical protein